MGDKGKGKREKHPEGEDEDEEDFQTADRVVKMIYGGPEQLESRRKAKLTARQLVLLQVQGQAYRVPRSTCAGRRCQSPSPERTTR